MINISFQTKIAQHSNRIFVDESQLTQVLINLLKNAIQATETKPEGNIGIEAFIENKKTIICVHNNGSKISPEVLPQIFVPFFTTKTNGTGIGLSISKQIIQLHNGSLEVFSDIDKTVFKITLPQERVY